MCILASASLYHLSTVACKIQNEPCHEEICLESFKPGLTQTGGDSYRLEISDLESRGIVLYME